MTDTPWEPLGPGIYYDVPEDVYHADPCEQPSLSSSLARVIVTESVQHAWHLHPKLGGKQRAVGKPAEMGTALHALAAGESLPPQYVLVQHADYRTKAAKEARDTAKARGQVPINQTEWGRLQEQARELREQQERQAEVLGSAYAGDPEVTIIWEEQSSYGPVMCRARLDRFDADRGLIHDVKRVECAAPGRIDSKIGSYGYHVQGAAYLRAVGAHMPTLRPDFMLHFIEGPPVWGYTPVQLSGAYRDLGEALWLRAVEAWGRGIHRGEWPAYVEPGSVHIAHPRPWQLESMYDDEQEAAQ